MGYLTEFNWILKLRDEQGLKKDIEIGKIYNFTKEGMRNYPLGYPLLLVNNNWEAVGLVSVINFKNDGISTKGDFKLLKIYESTEKEILTKFLQEGISYYKKEDISDFSKVKAT